MTFLAKLGSFLAKAVAIAAGVGPLVQPFLGSHAGVAPQVVNDLTQIGQVVLQAETLIQTPGSGPQKLQAASPLVGQIIRTSELVAGHRIANEALFLQGATKVTDGLADVLNSIDAGAAKQA